MIRRVVIRRFKRFDEVVFDLPGHIVLAGPNNTGKTTMLQAVAAWELALNRWKRLNDFNPRNHGYRKAPVTRQTFSAVPLRAFEFLWNQRHYQTNAPIEIEIHHTAGWKITMELIADSTEQIYVRPKSDVPAAMLREADLRTAFVPPMTGLSTDEPVYQRPKLDQLLGQGRPGEIIRNLLVEAHQSETAWRDLTASMQKLFGCEVLPPDASGADIIAEYQMVGSETRLDIASAGSGFQQVLMLLTFLNTRPGAVLLLDEPDAHLHVLLQDAIYSELRSVAARQNSQLIVATHSEVIINSVEPRELCVLFNQPRCVTDEAERTKLARSLGILTDTDIMLAMGSPGVLYVERHTDLNILREWARILDHPVKDAIAARIFWRPTVWENRIGAKGITAKDHYEALKLVRDDLPGLVMLDGDDDPRVPETTITGRGLQRVRWRRYEIESYLIHPAALARYIGKKIGDEAIGLLFGGFGKVFCRQLSARRGARPVGRSRLSQQHESARRHYSPGAGSGGLARHSLH
ncbi:MAG: AAA family ATPase [Acidobacteriota bacterium]